jgi:hypothetical protein
MSLVLCGHICRCTCHGPILRRHPGPELEKKYLLELPAQPIQDDCCDGLCPDGSGQPIKIGMTKAHLMKCCGKTYLEANELILKDLPPEWKALEATFH